MNAPHLRRWLGLIFLFSAIGSTQGQTTALIQSTGGATAVSTAPISPLQNTIQEFESEQRALAKQERALAAGGATVNQLIAWRQQNSSEFALQKQRAEAITIASALTLENENRQPRIPEDASTALRAFLTSQGALASAQAHIHNQLVQQLTTSGQSITFAQVIQLHQKEDELFQKQNATALASQAQQASAIATSLATVVQAIPGTATIPANTTSQQAAFLTTRSQVRRAMILLRNQYASATPAVKEAALQAWYKQNANRLGQLQQQAQSLSPATTGEN